jgi:hypothetical protein
MKTKPICYNSCSAILFTRTSSESSRNSFRYRFLSSHRLNETITWMVLLCNRQGQRLRAGLVHIHQTDNEAYHHIKHGLYNMAAAMYGVSSGSLMQSHNPYLENRDAMCVALVPACWGNSIGWQGSAVGCGMLWEHIILVSLRNLLHQLFIFSLPRSLPISLLS